MDYPRWAPPDLIQMHREHVEALALGPVHLPTEEEMSDPKSCQDCGCAVCHCGESRDHWLLRCDLEGTRTHEAIIGRMVRDGSMREFWAWIQTAEAKQQATAYEQKAGEIASVIWRQVWAYMERFKYLPKRTGAEKKKALGKIAKLTRELCDLIGGDEDGRHFEASVLQACMLRKVRELQRGYMQLPESEVWRWTDALPDNEEAREMLSGAYQFHDGTLQASRRMGERAEPFPRHLDLYKSDECLPWREQPLEQRLAWWHVETPKTCLLDLLDMFAEGIEREAGTPPIIKQRRDDGGWRAFMIRACAGMLRWRFMTVPAERIADLAGAVLDESLTRDDVRPYLR